jgi:hypothetical protein
MYPISIASAPLSFVPSQCLFVFHHLIRKEGVVMILDHGQAAAVEGRKKIKEKQKAEAEGLPPPTARDPQAIELCALNPNYVC